MRASYLSYAVKLIRERKFKTLLQQLYKIVAIPLSYSLKRSVCGPVHGIFVVNYECNQRCKMCNLYKRPLEYADKGVKKLTTQEMMSVIDDFADIGTSGIGFTGGEPILRNDIYELIKHAKGHGLFTHMSSNGMAIDLEAARKLIRIGLDAISFSLDGSVESTHDSIRGAKGSFEKAINAIKSCRTAKQELEEDKFVIISVCVINNKNIDEVIDLVDVALAAGVDKVSFSPVHDIGLMKNEAKLLNDLKVSEKNFKKVDDIVARLIEIKKNKGIIDNTKTYLRLFKRAFENKPLPFSCYAGYVTIGVDGYGNIFPCFGWMEMNRRAANVRELSLREFWKSKELKKMREQIADCRNCYWNNQAELNIAFSLKNLFKS